MLRVREGYAHRGGGEEGEHGHRHRGETIGGQARGKWEQSEQRPAVPSRAASGRTAARRALIAAMAAMAAKRQAPPPWRSWAFVPP